MRIERGLQVDHSEWVIAIADFLNEEATQEAYLKTVNFLRRTLEYTKGKPFLSACHSVDTREEAEQWIKEHYDGDPLGKVEISERDGRFVAWVRYPAAVDWDPKEVFVGADEGMCRVAVRIYTAGHGIMQLEDFLSSCSDVVNVELKEDLFLPLMIPLEEIEQSTTYKHFGKGEE